MALAVAAFVPLLQPRPPTRHAAQPPLLVVMRAADGERGPWSQRLRSAGTALATALVLVVPRGPARAAQLEDLSAPDATTITRSIGDARRRAPPEAAFLWFQRKKELVPPYLPINPPSPSEIDMDELVPKKWAHRFTDREFIFSDSLTAKSELEEEMDDLETYKDASRGTRALQGVVTLGGSAGLIYLSVKGLTGVEKWIKDQERKDIEEEMELTGTYISVDAGDVDSAIDPKTGKNLTISRGTKVNSTSAGDGQPKEAPWLLRVLGLGDSIAADDDDFWESSKPAPTFGPGKPMGDGGADAGGSGDGEGDGGGDTDGDGDGDDDDDSSGIDELDDLLG